MGISEMYYGFRIVKVFRIIMGKRVVNGHWIVWVFRRVSVLGM